MDTHLKTPSSMRYRTIPTFWEEAEDGLRFDMQGPCELMQSVHPHFVNAFGCEYVAKLENEINARRSSIAKLFSSALSINDRGWIGFLAAATGSEVEVLHGDREASYAVNFAGERIRIALEAAPERMMAEWGVIKSKSPAAYELVETLKTYVSENYENVSIFRPHTPAPPRRRGP